MFGPFYTFTRDHLNKTINLISVMTVASLVAAVRPRTGKIIKNGLAQL